MTFFGKRIDLELYCVPFKKVLFFFSMGIGNHLLKKVNLSVFERPVLEPNALMMYFLNFF